MLDLGSLICETYLLLIEENGEQFTNLEKCKDFCDWLCEGYGGKIDRAQLTLCCEWRRDFNKLCYEYYIQDDTHWQLEKNYYR
jgi:hypothetical protein